MLREKVISASWTLGGRPCSPAELGLYDTTNAFCLAHTLESCCASGATKPRFRHVWTVTSPVFHPCRPCTLSFHPKSLHRRCHQKDLAAAPVPCCCFAVAPVLVPREGKLLWRAVLADPGGLRQTPPWRREFLSVSCFVNAMCS